MIRMALIGCDRAEEYAAACLRTAGVLFTAVVDPDLNAARRKACMMHAPHYCTTADELFTGYSDAFDAVLIDTPAGTRGSDVEAAAAAGKNVLAEMPLATTIQECERAVTACRTAGVCLMAGNPLRYLPPSRKVKEHLESGKLGKPGMLRLHHWESLRSLDWNRFPPEDATGNGMVNRVIADLDLANYFFSAKPVTLYAAGRREDYIQVHLEYPEGGMALIDYSLALAGVSSYFSVSMVGSAGAVYGDDHQNVNLLLRGGETIGMNTGYGHGHLVSHLLDFAGFVEENHEPAVREDDNREAVRAAGAAMESLQAGLAVRLEGGRYATI